MTRIKASPFSVLYAENMGANLRMSAAVIGWHVMLQATPANPTRHASHSQTPIETVNGPPISVEPQARITSL